MAFTYIAHTPGYDGWATVGADDCITTCPSMPLPPDTTAPIVTITSAGGDQTETTYALTGTVVEDIAIATLTYRVNGEAPVAMTPAATFAETVAVRDGWNTISVVATDTSGNVGFDVVGVDVTTQTVNITSGAFLYLALSSHVREG